MPMLVFTSAWMISLLTGWPILFFFSCWPCCGTFCTTNCSGGMNNSFQVDVSSVTTGTCASSCNPVNGSFVLPKTATDCVWDVTTGFACTFVEMHYELNIVFSASHYFLNLWLYFGGTVPGVGTDILWAEDLGTSQPDCTTFSSHSIPFSNEGVACLGTGSTALLTSL